jgi:fatty-acyl-CoA synthase
MTRATITRPAINRGASEATFREQSVGDLLFEIADRFPDRYALIVPAGIESSERCWSYAELRRAAEQVAAALLARFSSGDRVATWAGGSAEIILLELGAALAGVTLVTINPANRSAEMEYTLAKSRARGLFLDRVYRGMDNQAVIEALRGTSLPDLESVHYLDEWEAFVASPAPSVLPVVAPDAPALILFTSGSSGKPKAAMLHHAGIVNNAALTAAHLDVPAGSTWLNLLPMFHVGGSVTITLGCIANAGTQVLLAQFSPDAVLDAIARYGVYITMAVPTMLVGLLESPKLLTTDLSSLRIIVAGGSALAPDLLRRVKAQLDTEVASLMGQTEASGAMFSTRPGDSEDQVCHSVGGPLALSEVKIADTADGHTLAIGEPGEICIRSRCTMLGYFDMPEKTAETLKDGWLHTGDIGLMREDGYVQITGRMSDMIIRGGENIYPREIEDVLSAHACVAQVAVFGVPDERWGEQVAAAVIARPGTAIDTDELTEWLRARIARHRVPRYWQVLEELPVNASGKVQKFVLQDRFANA